MNSEDDRYLADKEIDELHFSRPLRPHTKTCKSRISIDNGLMVCNCAQHGRDSYDVFQYYKPSFYQASEKLPAAQADIKQKKVRWPHLEFVTTTPEEFTATYGLPLVESQQWQEKERINVCCLPLERYDSERQLFILFYRLQQRLKRLSALRQKGGVEKNKECIIEKQRELINVIEDNDKIIRWFFDQLEQAKEANDQLLDWSFIWQLKPGYRNSSHYIGDQYSVRLLLGGIFDFKINGIRPSFSLPDKTGWMMPDLLSGLYLMHWLDAQQGKYVADCDNCGSPFVVGKRKRFCGQVCSNRFHVRESKKRQKYVSDKS